jgi:hypothetical protein
MAQEVDLRPLVLYTELPYMWDVFRDIISISPMTENGFTLSCAEFYLNGMEPLQVTHQEFWYMIRYFLGRMNDKFYERRKQKLSKS